MHCSQSSPGREAGTIYKPSSKKLQTPKKAEKKATIIIATF